MRSKADVVIVGGGIIGVAVAFYLAKQKFGQIMVLEKEPFLGSGSTTKAAGGIRAQFSTKTNIEMSMLSEELFCRFKEDTGSEALYDQVGYLFALSDEADIVTFKKHYELQRSLGLKVELLKPEDIPQYAPHIRLDDIKLATFCHDDGLGDPSEFLRGYDQAIRKLNVDIELETPVTGFMKSGNKITGIKTKNGDISTPLVINCAGAWAGEIGKLAGADVKVEPIKRQCVTTGELDFIKPFFPMVVDVKSGLYFHKESKGLLLGWADKNMPVSFDVSIDPDYTDAILERALDRIPQLETAEVANVWAGLYETTPDHQAIIGYDLDVEGLFHVTGFSGHGFMHAPAAGVVTAEIVSGKKPTIDVTPLGPARFAKGAVTHETNVI
ncbi:MAG: FAD-binding oxidoreductase [Candidatus Zixiibacteriota bacterium]